MGGKRRLKLQLESFKQKWFVIRPEPSLASAASPIESRGMRKTPAASGV
jgi:hypothetical protein